jgi:hypothetical protein
MRLPVVHRVIAASLAGAVRAGSADAGLPVPVTIAVVGHGEIRLVVADGASLPCDASDNRMLMSDRVRAGDEIKLGSTKGSVCVDHTYGSLRESQWAGPSIWSGRATWPGGPEAVIHGTVSTDEP